MSPRSIASRVRRRRVLLCMLVAIVASVLLVGRPGGGVSRAAGEGPAEPIAQTDASVPAREVTLIGATPGETGGGSDETWGIGSGSVIVRYSGAGGEGGWSPGPGVQDESGAPLAGFQLDKPEAFNAGAAPSPIAAQMTADGAGAMVGFNGENHQVVLVREPGGPANAFREVKAVPEADLPHKETLFGFTKAPLIAPLDEAGGHAGALVVPVIEHGGTIGEERVLHWSGEKQEWAVEPIHLPADAVPAEFHVLGIGAGAPGNAWLLAQLSAGKVGLFRREVGSSEATWQPIALKQGGEPGEPLQAAEELLTIPGQDSERVQTQVLTVTEQGVWVDGERAAVQASTTLYVKPGAEGGAPSISSWCTLEHSPAGTKPCEGSLPEALPTGPSRSFAWASSAAFGDRVITGLPDGVSLRLDGSSFTRVLALGGSVGGAYGAAFSGPREGWLGDSQLPVHLTASPAPGRLTPWPTAFRHALLAAASQPGVPAGAIASGAVAVGDLGEVARYQPGAGWLPESLFGTGGRIERPELRAVAWPTPARIYAVGDCLPLRACSAQMWLWRGESGLWEPDPATPTNFRGNLLGIAFDPNNPARGYAVGESGVLLRYGKSWTQAPPAQAGNSEALPGEPPCLPQQASNSEETQRCSSWSNASFTSVAFAGSEAIVAYRVLPNRSSNRYAGGLIVNTGSGWHIDGEAAAAMGSRVPWPVAALPDGGAAFAASGSIFERQGSSSGWQAVPVPFPGGGEPGSLALFREGGELRAIAAGSSPDTLLAESSPEAPPGFPPTLVPPYRLEASSERALIRQTATGWSDEQHELNDARAPAGTNYDRYDTVYQPDPIAAVLIDSGGGQGWAVGGSIEPEEHGGVLDTAEIARYRDGSPPPGVGTSAVSAQPVTFAVGGNAGCAAVCADRANARIGPDVWLSAAVQRASSIPGVRAFLYTGPHLPDPHATEGHKVSADRINYAQEFSQYAGLLGSSQLPTYAGAAPTDLDESESEGSFESTFEEGFPYPFRFAQRCNGAPGCQGSYYAQDFSAGTSPEAVVRVLMLDESSEVGAAQLSWVAGQLAAARAAPTPTITIAVGKADVSAEIAEGNHPGAAELARVFVQGGASAYFFDAPEENIEKRVQAGAESIPAFGSGTLGYVNYQAETNGAFLGASGFLLAQVEVGTRNSATNRAIVRSRLVPNIGELAIEAKDGLLLHRSQVALFSGLARRPRAGNRSPGHGQVVPDTDPYIPIPSNCVGTTCASAISTDFSFTSSKPKIGNFVAPNLASPDSHAVLLGGPKEEPIPDPQSGLFCAYNAGTTIVTINAGGLSYSLPVTVQAGSVRRPCATVPLEATPVSSQGVAAPPPLEPTPASGPGPASSPPVPLPAAPVAPPVPVAAKPPAPPLALTPFVPPSAPATPLLSIVPPPLPTPARPTPPSGTSAVSQPVEAAEKEEEQEEATESVSNQAVAYHAPEHEPPTAYLLGLALIAAFAGASLRGRTRRSRREKQLATVALSSERRQRPLRSRKPPRW